MQATWSLMQARARAAGSDPHWPGPRGGLLLVEVQQRVGSHAICLISHCLPAKGGRNAHLCGRMVLIFSMSYLGVK